MLELLSFARCHYSTVEYRETKNYRQQKLTEKPDVRENNVIIRFTLGFQTKLPANGQLDSCGVLVNDWLAASRDHIT